MENMRDAGRGGNEEERVNVAWGPREKGESIRKLKKSPFQPLEEGRGTIHIVLKMLHSGE